MSDAVLGIDVSKETLDAYCCASERKQSKTFANSPDGWKLLQAWLKAMGSKQAHVCMEATGRYSLGVALALHEAGRHEIQASTRPELTAPTVVLLAERGEVGPFAR